MHSQLHDMKSLLSRGAKKMKLRAHSDLLPNRATNAWALTFLDNFDIQVEAKAKNLAAEQLYKQSLNNS
jgi:UV DNA damage endonuclease